MATALTVLVIHVFVIGRGRHMVSLAIVVFDSMEGCRSCSPSIATLWPTIGVVVAGEQMLHVGIATAVDQVFIFLNLQIDYLVIDGLEHRTTA